jgi:hypothetical protein
MKRSHFEDVFTVKSNVRETGKGTAAELILEIASLVWPAQNS